MEEEKRLKRVEEVVARGTIFASTLMEDVVNRTVFERRQQWKLTVNDD